MLVHKMASKPASTYEGRMETSVKDEYKRNMEKVLRKKIKYSISSNPHGDVNH